MKRKDVIFFLAACVVLILYVLMSKWPNTRVDMQHLGFSGIPTVFKEPFLVDTPSCRIPNLDPLDISVRHWIPKPRKIICPRDLSYTFGSHGKVFVNWTAVNISNSGNFSHCTHQSIRHTENGKHNDITYSTESKKFRDSIKVSGEFVRVQCYNSTNAVIYTNFHYIYLPQNDTYTKVNFDDLSPSILMVGIDSVSRMNYLRYMKRTRQLMLTMNALEFLGYNKVADNTFVNLVPLLSGKFSEQLPWNENIRHQTFDSFRFIWDDFKEKGFITLFVEDSPNMATFDNAKAGFRNKPTDYYNRPMAVAMEQTEEIWFEDHNCVLDRLETDVLLEYVSDYVRAMTHYPYFAFVYLSRMTHDYIQGAGSIDDLVHTFFRGLYNGGFLRTTVVIVFSDHGMRFGEIRNTYIGKLEERLPLVNVIVPEMFSKEHSEFMKHLTINTRRLTTPFDLHEFLKNVLHRNKYRPTSKRAFSLLAQIPLNRTCESAEISPHWCTCTEMITVSTNSSIVKKISNTFVENINLKLSNVSSICANLSLEDILLSYLIKPQDNLLKFESIENEVLHKKIQYGDPVNAVVDYQVTIRTQPGGGVFEGTFRFDEEFSALDLVSDISRLNRYNDSSNCVQKSELRKLCYCKNRVKLTKD